jgi:nitrogen regulatory protein PII
MKEISIFIRTDDLVQVTEILKKNSVGGISFYDINGAGRTKRDAIPEMVRSYMTGRTITPEYVKRTKVETIVLDSAVKQIVDDISGTLSRHTENEPHGTIFIKDVSELGTKQRGEAVLSSS